MRAYSSQFRPPLPLSDVDAIDNNQLNQGGNDSPRTRTIGTSFPSPPNNENSNFKINNFCFFSIIFNNLFILCYKLIKNKFIKKNNIILFYKKIV